MDPLSLAEHIGRHAVGWWAVTLAALTATVLLAWSAGRRARRWSVERRSRRPEQAWQTLVLAQALGLGGIVLSGLAFAEVAQHLKAGRRIGALDDALTASVGRHLDDGARLGFALLSHAGDAFVLTALGAVVAVLLLRQGHRLLALGWVLALAGNGLMIRLLKAVFERARPEHSHELAVAWGYSFPSGHTSGATVAYGLCAWLALRTLPPRWHLPALVGAAALVWTVGWSRVLLEVHYASDVVAGWLSGGAWLLASILALELARRWRRPAHLSEKPT